MYKPIHRSWGRSYAITLHCSSYQTCLVSWVLGLDHHYLVRWAGVMLEYCVYYADLLCNVGLFEYKLINTGAKEISTYLHTNQSLSTLQVIHFLISQSIIFIMVNVNIEYCGSWGYASRMRELQYAIHESIPSKTLDHEFSTNYLVLHQLLWSEVRLVAEHHSRSQWRVSWSTASSRLEASLTNTRWWRSSRMYQVEEKQGRWWEQPRLVSSCNNNVVMTQWVLNKIPHDELLNMTELHGKWSVQSCTLDDKFYF